VVTTRGASAWVHALAVSSIVLSLGACSDDSAPVSGDGTSVDPSGAQTPDANWAVDARLDGGSAPAPDMDASSPVLIDATLGNPEAPDAQVSGLADASQSPPDAARPKGKQAYAETFLGDHAVEVKITLAPADWDRIRNEGQTVNAVFSNCLDPNFDYTKVEGTVSIDGEVFGKVAVRKKGYLGSLSVVRPSLKVGLDTYVSGQNYHGVEELTLNSSRLDSTRIHTCLAYGVFAAAGLPTPGCTLARVFVNDQLLGVYANVEPIKKPLLRRSFASDDGNLYEGNAGADLRADSLFKFEKKTNESNTDLSDLARVAAALEIADDATMLQELDKVLDVEQFLRFWAAESLVGHWDGYTGDLNNFYVYVDPTTNKLTFLPYGPDGTFTSTHSFLPATPRPPVTYAWSRLPRRLYAYEPTRERYRAALRAVLDQSWDVAKLGAEIDRLEALVGSDANPAAVDQLRTFIAERRATVEGELSATVVPWSIPERPAPACNAAANSKISGRFTTTWGTLDAPDLSFDALDVTIDQVTLKLQPTLVGAGGFIGTSAPTGAPSLRIIGTLPASTTAVTVQLALGGPKPAPNTSVAFHGVETAGALLVGDLAGPFTLLGFIGGGKVTFEEYEAVDGAPVTGSFEGTFTQTVPSPTPITKLELPVALSP
jgi:spore coat protein H